MTYQHFDEDLVTTVDTDGVRTTEKLVRDEYFKRFHAEEALLTFSNYEGDVRSYGLDICGGCVFPLYSLENYWKTWRKERYDPALELAMNVLPQEMRLLLQKEISLINECINDAPKGYHLLFKIIVGLYPSKSYWIHKLRDGRYEFSAYLVRRYVKYLEESGLNVTSREIITGSKVTYYVKVIIDNPGEWLRYLLARACDREKVSVYQKGGQTKVFREMVVVSREEMYGHVAILYEGSNRWSLF